MTDKIGIKKLGDKYFVFDAKDVEQLRTNYRIVGALNGTLPQFPLQNTFYGLPLILLPEEVELLVNRGWAHIIQKPSKTTSSTTMMHNKEPHITTIVQKQTRLNADVFDFFWSQGYYITSGIKFGGQFLLYPNDPMCVHSEYIVSVKQTKDQDILPLELIGMGRTATNVRKTFVIVAADQEEGDDEQEQKQEQQETSQMVCYSIEWAGF
ncbi:tRNA-splicing endonuclease subunit [Mucor circinelloides]